MLRSGDCMFIVKHSVGTICVSLHSSHCLLSCTHSALPLLHYIQAIRSQSCQEAWDRKVTEIVEWSDAGRRDWVHLVCLQKLIHCCPIPLFFFAGNKTTLCPCCCCCCAATLNCNVSQSTPTNVFRSLFHKFSCPFLKFRNKNSNFRNIFWNTVFLCVFLLINVDV